MNSLTVTTIRHRLTDLQLSEIMTQYQTDAQLAKRVDIDKLAKTGFSRVATIENGYSIETIVAINKE